MKQTERLHEYLTKVGPINPLEAWRELGIYRLAARVCDLRAAGVPVKQRRVAVSNRWGESAIVAEYYLGEG